MKKLFFIFALLWSVVGAWAQSDFFACSRDVKYDRFEELGGKHGFFIISKQKDVVIRVISVSGESPKPVCSKGSEEGTYEYLVVLDASESYIPKIEVSRRGNVYKTEFTVEQMKADYLLAYRLEETTNPIRLDDQTQANDVLTDETAAELEFTTTIENLTVTFNSVLGVNLTKSKKKGDNTVSIITAIIPMQKLNEAKNHLASIRQEHETLEKRLLNQSGKAEDSDWDKLDQLDEAVKKAASDYQELCEVMVYADQTNHLSIDISNLTARVKKCYVVLPVVVEKTVYETECSAHMATAASNFAKRRYVDARTEYENALSSKDVLPNMKASLQRSIAECDSCIDHDAKAVVAVNRIKELRDKGNATQKEVAEYATSAIHHIEVLYNYNPDDVYTARIEKLKQFIEDIPLEIAFTVVEWKTLQEGNALPDVEIWVYYGKEPMENMTFTSDRKFRKAIDKEKSMFVQKGVTDAKGKATVELPRKQMPTAVVFNPYKNENVKIKTLGMNELMRGSKGTYMKRQFRLKMYTR